MDTRDGYTSCEKIATFSVTHLISRTFDVRKVDLMP